MTPISHLRSLTLATPKLDESAAYYTSAYGLQVARRTDDAVTLASKQGGPDLLVIRRAETPHFVGLSLAVRTADSVREAADTLRARGLTVRTGETPNSIGIVDPDGNAIELTHDETEPSGVARSDGMPLHISHVVLNSPDPDRLTAFFTDVLGFTIADRYENKLLNFLRCDQPQHHCIGISPGTGGHLNHFSMECGSIDAVMKGIGRMQKGGYTPIWGPGRHGPGGNVFCYFEDPSGFVAEFTTDVIQITEPANWVAKEWARVPEVANVWQTGGPSPRAMELMGGRLPT